MSDQPEFKRCKPSRWHGRYARIPGDGSVFHLKQVNGRMWPAIYWEREAGTWGTCAAFEGEATRLIVDAVGDAKRKAGGSGGGSFVINEYGQALVPASDGSGRRYIVGELKGRWPFENPFDGGEIDLGDCNGLKPGDPWKWPYVGFPFNLHARGKIYFNQEDEEGRRSIYPERQNLPLIEALRTVRSSGPVRFIVNPFGVVLTKRQMRQGSPEDRWQPVYVGKINLNLWFEKGFIRESTNLPYRVIIPQPFSDFPSPAAIAAGALETMPGLSRPLRMQHRGRSSKSWNPFIAQPLVKEA